MRSRLAKWLEIPASDFDLEKTLESGQVFHWTRAGNGFVGVIGAQPVYVEQRGDLLKLLAVSETGEMDAVAVRCYFALDHPLRKIRATFPDDAAMHVATEFCRGLRILRQPIWECVATFITSSMKQVAHIAQISHMLRQRYGTSCGERVEFANGERDCALSANLFANLFAYPDAEKIAVLDEATLRECKLGFRAKNLLGAARMVANGEVDLRALENCDDETALRELMRLPGVGEKVGNCVLLFAYGRLGAFPIDVWIARVLRTIYFPRKRKVSLKELKKFSQRHFGGYGGYAQQYLFHHARKTVREKLKTPIDRANET